MTSRFDRTEALLGSKAMDRLKKSAVVVFGIGGVGSFLAEALARSGIGAIALVDFDVVDVTNLNRQVHALDCTVGKPKVLVMQERIKTINPACIVHTHQTFITKENASAFLKGYDYAADAVDNITAKLSIIEEANNQNIPVVSAMGAGNKLHPEHFEITDIYQTSVCPLARVMRKELKKRGIQQLTVCYSKEAPIPPNHSDNHLTSGRKIPPGSVSFVPSVCGLLMAGEIIRNLAGIE